MGAPGAHCSTTQLKSEHLAFSASKTILVPATRWACSPLLGVPKRSAIASGRAISTIEHPLWCRVPGPVRREDVRAEDELHAGEEAFRFPL